MSLEKWLEYGWLKRESTTPNEIRGLLSVMRRGLSDSSVKAVSADLRFIAAFNVAMAAATTALRVSGYRVSTQPGHHFRTIESLECTIGADTKIIDKLRGFSTKRNRSVYDVAGVISEQDLAEMIKLATSLQRDVLAWLQKFHPQQLK